MWKYIIFFVIWFGVVFGQNIEPDSVSEVHTDSYDKSLSIEIIGGTYFTFEHWMEYSGTTLPFSMWRGGVKVSYQFVPHLTISLRGGYSYTKNLDYMVLDLWSDPEFAFTVSNVAFLLSYRIKTFGNTCFLIGGGIRFKEKDDDTDFHLGVRIGGGIEYLISQFGIFLELYPVVDVVPETGFDFEGGIGGRFFF